jgi:type I restriction enzyme S subunit
MKKVKCNNRKAKESETKIPSSNSLLNTQNSSHPKGWVWAELGEIASYINGKAFKPSEWEKHGKPIIRIQNLTGSSNKVNYYSKPVEEDYIIKDGDLLISWSATLGVFIYRGEDAVLNQHIFKVKPYIDKKFLYFLVSAFIDELKRKVHGTGMQHITKSKFEESQIPLPPLPEQQRIVSKIEELFTKLEAGVDALKKAKEQIKRYRQAVLKYAFEGKLTEEWREANMDKLESVSVLLERIKEERKKKLGKKYKELPPIDTSELPELPEGWMWTCLGNIAEFKNGINFNKDLKGNKGILTVDVLNMYSRGVFLNLDGLYRVNKVVNQEYLLRDGDVLFVRSSVKREGIGWASAFKEIAEPVTFCGFIIRARFPKYRIHPKYAVYFLRMDFARKLIIGKGSQVTITNISQNSLATIPFPLATTTEQQKIVEEIERRFSVADEVEKIIDNSLKQAERLRQSILKKAFEGKLVPQDPSDEPAEKLLERIKAEKENNEKRNRKS